MNSISIPEAGTLYLARAKEFLPVGAKHQAVLMQAVAMAIDDLKGKGIGFDYEPGTWPANSALRDLLKWVASKPGRESYMQWQHEIGGLDNKNSGVRKFNRWLQSVD